MEEPVYGDLVKPVVKDNRLQNVEQPLYGDLVQPVVKDNRVQNVEQTWQWSRLTDFLPAWFTSTDDDDETTTATTTEKPGTREPWPVPIPDVDVGENLPSATIDVPSYKKSTIISTYVSVAIAFLISTLWLWFHPNPHPTTLATIAAPVTSATTAPVTAAKIIGRAPPLPEPPLPIYSCGDHCVAGHCDESGCSLCIAGFHIENRTCMRCAPGFSGDGETCSPCSVGHFSDRNGSVSCKQCPAGQYQNQTGQISCYYAQPGYYQNLPGQAMQVPCIADLNKYTDYQGAIEPSICPHGTFTSRNASTYCESCADAFQSTDTEHGDDVCQACQWDEC